MSPRVSVVIPTYKSAAWVEETLESVIRQTYPAELLEIVVVDDASPDDSVRVASKFLERQAVKSRVVAREKNAGAGANRNAGWQLAEGDWIQFLDADDLLAPHKIALQMQRVSDAPDDVAVVYSSWQYYMEQDGKWQASGPLNAPFVDDSPIVRILEHPTFGYVGPTLMRRSYVAKVQGFIEKPNLGEDLDLMLRIAMAGGKYREARSEGKPGLLYRQWPDSLWRSYMKNVEAMRNVLQTFRNAEEFLREQSPGGLSREAKTALATRYSRWADFYREQDPETFQKLKGWLHGLGLNRPNNLSKGMDLLASVIGYDRACQARDLFRDGKKRLRS